jgi:magnesium transporter
MLLAVCHSAVDGWSQVRDLASVSDLRAGSDNLLWAEADVANLTRAEIELIAEEFGLDDLAVEDAANPRQRPKLEEYDSHKFLVVHQLDEQDSQLEATQLAIFIGDRYVLTIHDGAERTIAEAKKRWRSDKWQYKDPSYLVHTLLDVVVDDYQRIADQLEIDIEGLEDIVLAAPDAPVQRQIYSLKQQTARLRRYAFPAARTIDWAMDPDTPNLFSDTTVPLFKDVHDHLQRITDQVRNIDDLTQAVLDLHQSHQARALNETTKKLSGWAAIFAIATLIAGIYGMNFELFPFDGESEGFWFAVALMGAACLGMYLYFKKRDWI